MSLKVFDLVQVIERCDIKIECFEASGNDLYLGSDDGAILHYVVEERSDQAVSTVVYTTNKISQKIIGTKKPIQQLKAASALGRLLTLSDGNLYLLESDILNVIGSGPKIKNVLVFCVNENPNILDPFTIQLCIGKKKGIQICSLHENRISLLHEISTSDPPMNVSMDGNYVCFAGQSQYAVCNIETKGILDLFPFDPNQTYPHINRVAKEEFLLAAPGNLGMFVTAAGISERPPIQWSDGVASLAYYHPYVLTISQEFVRIFSLVDQQHKQAISFNGGRIMGNFDGQLYIGTPKCVYCLMPQPWTAQVQALLADERVEEAVELAEHSGGAGMTLEQYQSLMNDILQRAAFVKLSQFVYDEAEDLFLKGKVDIRELVVLFPDLMPSNSSFMRKQPPLHQMADIIQACHGDAQQVENAKRFLINYLLTVRASGDSHRMEIDTALIKMYAEKQSEDLFLFLKSGDINCYLPDCTQWLEKYSMYSALSYLYRTLNELEKALSIISKLHRGEYKDPSYEGITQLIDCLVETTDVHLLLKYANFVLESAPVDGVRIFTETDAEIDPHQVIKILIKYPEARLIYLHHLIDNKDLQEEAYHTELVLHYVDLAIKYNAEDNVDTPELLVDETRNKLQSLIDTSKFYNPQIVLARLQNSNLYQETATVYRRLGQHEKALSILVHKLKDFEAAEQYCIQCSKDTEGDKKYEAFIKLLKIYLRPPPGGSEDDIELGAAIELLSIHAEELKLEMVLEILPSHWSLSIAHHYLRAALRSSLHQSRLKLIKQKLVKCENFQQKYVLDKMCQDMGPIPLSVNRMCSVCGKGFRKCEFVIYPNGVMAHKECAPSKHVCPLTGTVFKVTNQSR